MTIEILNKLIKENNIPNNVIIRSDSGWECGDTPCDGVWYNKKKNIIMLTQDIEGTSHLYDTKYENGIPVSKTVLSDWVCLSTNVAVKDLDNSNSAYIVNRQWM